MDITNAKADVYVGKVGVYYIKISMRDIGMYISGITVKKSPKYDDWWVQMPYYKDYKSNKTKRYIEFDQESPMRIAIERLCIEAVEKKITDAPIAESQDNLTGKQISG